MLLILPSIVNDVELPSKLGEVAKGEVILAIPMLLPLGMSPYKFALRIAVLSLLWPRLFSFNVFPHLGHPKWMQQPQLYHWGFADLLAI